ncbi:MAG: hypothetical protein IJ688_06185 [Treponema sp.]|nr:hypothetical protein [Treponema sp.]
MAYKIAIASSNGINVDIHFGAAQSFFIYAVKDDGTFSEQEKRDVPETAESSNAANSSNGGCGKGGAGCHGNGGGCGQGAGISPKVELITDCRCVVAAKIGFNVIKQLERKAIASFDVETTVQEALEKITKYFYSIDNHKSFSLKK